MHRRRYFGGFTATITGQYFHRAFRALAIEGNALTVRKNKLHWNGIIIRLIKLTDFNATVTRHFKIIRLRRQRYTVANTGCTRANFAHRRGQIK